MIESTLKTITSKISDSPSLSGEDKAVLLKLCASLESEIIRLAEVNAEHGESIAGFIERSTHEATRKQKNPELLSISLAGPAASVKGFEASHPRLVEDINYISTVLANVGI